MTIQGAGTARIDNLLKDTRYTVTEQNLTGWQLIGVVPSNGEAIKTITAGEEDTITFKNARLVDIHVVKIDESTRDGATITYLKGAQFALARKGDEEGSDYAPYPNASQNTQTSGADGKLTFQDLPDGQYRISEVKAPDGYYAANISIYFSIVEGTVIWTDSEGTVITEQSLVSYDAIGSEFTVGNTSGVALPGTGGSGTLPYTVAGLALILIAGVFLVARKRRKV